MTAHTIMLRFAPDHPTAAGHFPGNPIIPGALLLAEVVREIAASLGQELDAATVKSAKFFHPVRPGDGVRIEYEVSGQHQIRFQCSVAETRVLTGVMDAANGA